MHPLDQKLANWTAAYSRLKEVQAQLNGSGLHASLDLKESVSQAQRDAEHALADMEKEFDHYRQKQRPNAAS